MASAVPTSTSTAISTTSFYGTRGRAQHERRHFQVIEPNFDGSDTESNFEEDEPANIEDASEYEESSDDSNESDTDLNGDNDETADDNSMPTGKSASNAVHSQNMRWRKRQPIHYDVAFKGEPFPPPPLEEYTPLQYFKQFFDNALIDHLVEQTNLYSMQSTGNSIAVDHDEMEMYLGLLVMMSIIKLPQICMYWSKETTIPLVADVMLVNHLEKIKQFFHCNDNTKNLPSTDKDYDKLFKVRSVIESLKEKCRQISQEECHSVDEQIIPTKSRTSLQQYLPNKPNKWGIKVWARCGVSGMLYDFEVYTGKSNKTKTKPELLMGGNVVYRLTRTLPRNVNYKVFFDNFFSSIPLMSCLKNDGFWAVATIRNDQLKGAQNHLQSEKELKKSLQSEKELKKSGRGSFDYVVEANSGTTVVRWFDNGLVQMLSNYVGNDLSLPAHRWSKKEGRFINIDRPAMVVEYNSYMGGVDLCDMLISAYRIRHRSTKYYMHIVFYCIGVAVVNGWLLYRRHMGQKDVPAKRHLSLLKFQDSIAVSLTKAGKVCGEASRPRRRPSASPTSANAVPSKKRKAASVPNPTQDVQFDQVGHFPEFQEK